MALRNRSIKYFFELWWLVGSRGFTIWVLSTSFQKSSIGWPHQPPTEKVLKFKVIFRNSTQNFFISNFSTLSIRGCWGQPILLFWKLVDKTQISKPPEPTRHHNSIKLWILLSLRADLLYILQYETPCIYFFCHWSN